MTAFVTERELKEVRSAGMTAYLPKPFSRDQLKAVLTGFGPEPLSAA